MRWPRPDPSAQPQGEFARARAQAEKDTGLLRIRAARTVAGHASDPEDRSQLLAMLGLDDPPGTGGPDMRGLSADRWVSFERGLAGYVGAVAAAIGVPSEATGFEISDTVTAYLGLALRSPRWPGRDLMLVWGERVGWFVAVETAPAEPSVVIGYLGGADLVPAPLAVANFVSGVLRSGSAASRPNFAPLDRDVLFARLSRYLQRL